MGRVVVVGAGISGLTATYELRKKGLDVVTLEKGERAGGRAVRIVEDGFVTDIGAQVASRDYRAIVGLIRELGLGSDMVTRPARVRMWKDGSLYPFSMSLDPGSLLEDLKYLRTYSLRDLGGLSRMMGYFVRKWKAFDMDSLDFELDGRSFAEIVLDKAGNNPLEYFFQPAITGLVLEDPEQVGATLGMICLRLTIRAFVTGLIIMRNGFGSIAECLQARCADSIMLSTAADRIVIENGAVKGVSVGNDFIDADAVVCATTAPAALELMPGLPPSLAGPLGKAGYGPCCHVAFAVDAHPFREGEIAVYLPRKSGSSLAAMMSGRGKHSSYAPPSGDVVHCFTYGRQAMELNRLPDHEAAGIVMREATKYLPALPDKPVFTQVFKFNEAVYVNPPCSFRQLREIAGRRNDDVKGLYLAGEYLVVGGVESGVRSAVETAAAVVRSLG